MWWMFLLVVVFGVVIAALSANSKRSGSTNTVPEAVSQPSSKVMMKPSQVLNGTEARIYEQLVRVIPQGYWVFPQVRLADVVHPVHSDRSLWQSAQNRLSLKHVDFAIVRASDRLCHAVIEVDGPDHDRRVQQERDAVKDAALQQAGIPCIRLGARSYSPEELAQRLGPVFGTAQVAATSSAVGRPTPRPKQ